MAFRHFGAHTEAPTDPASETLLGLLPALLHRDPKTAFMVGLGGGVTLRALLKAKLDSVRVVELEPAIRDALATVLDPKSRVSRTSG